MCELFFFHHHTYGWGRARQVYYKIRKPNGKYPKLCKCKAAGCTTKPRGGHDATCEHHIIWQYRILHKIKQLYSGVCSDANF